MEERKGYGKKNHTRNRLIQKIKSIWFVLKIIVLISFVAIAIFILIQSIINYYELDFEESLLKNQHICSIQIVKIAYKFKVHTSYLSSSLSKYQDDINNVKQYGKPLYNSRLESWNNWFVAIKNDIDSTLLNFKKVMDSAYPRPEYYTGFRDYFDNPKNYLVSLLNELLGYQKVKSIILGIENKYNFDLIRISVEMEDKISEYSVEKAFLKSKILNIENQRNQQLLNILASILTLFFIYIEVIEFNLFKRIKHGES